MYLYIYIANLNFHDMTVASLRSANETLTSHNFSTHRIVHSPGLNLCPAPAGGGGGGGGGGARHGTLHSIGTVLGNLHYASKKSVLKCVPAIMYASIAE